MGDHEYGHGDMVLRTTTIRFDPRAQALVAQAAAELEISVSQFVRESAVIRAVLTLQGPLDEKEAARLAQLAREVVRLSRTDNPD